MKNKQANQIALVQEIKNAAQLYSQNLVGRKFLYVYENKYVEIIYTIKAFRHLTGVETNLSAKSFFKLALDNKLAANQIYFTSKHPYHLCVRKVKHLCELTDIATSEGFMLEEVNTNSQTFKISSTNLKFSLCFNPSKDANGNIINEVLHAESLRDEDCFKRCKHAFEVTHIFSKDNDKQLYSKIEYVDKRYDVKDVPEEIKGKIDFETIVDV